MRKLVQLLGAVLIFQGAGAIVDHFVFRLWGELFLVRHLPFLAGYRLFASVILGVLGAVLMIAPAEIGARPDAGHRGVLRRAAPALGLFFLAPLVAEYLLGNVPSEEILALPVLALMYGGGAVLIREVARRTGRGWSTILLLALAYGVIEPGLFDHSLFNPSFEILNAQRSPSYLPALGVSAAQALSFPVGHAVWSISVPIVVVEALVPRRRTAPWLGRIGLAGAAAAYLLGGAVVFDWAVRTERFLPSVPQMVSAATVAVALIGVAFAVRKPRTEQSPVEQPRTAGEPPAGQALVGSPPVDGDGASPPPLGRRAPRPWLVGVAAFVAAGMFSARDESWWSVAIGVAVIAVTTVVVIRWSRRTGWGAPHRLALAGGALLTYVWLGFVLLALKGNADTGNLAGQAVLVVAMVTLLVAAARTARGSGGIGERVDAPPGANP